MNKTERGNKEGNSKDWGAPQKIVYKSMGGSSKTTGAKKRPKDVSTGMPKNRMCVLVCISWLKTRSHCSDNANDNDNGAEKAFYWLNRSAQNSPMLIQLIEVMYLLMTLSFSLSWHV